MPTVESVPEPGEKDSSLARVWAAALEQLRLEMSKSTFETWVRDTHALNVAESLFENSCVRQSFGHQADGSDVNEGFTRLGQPFIILTQAAIAT